MVIHWDGTFKMRTVGIVGGLGPESTIDYYRSIIARFRERDPQHRYPAILINSLDVDKGIDMLNQGRLDDLADYLVAGFEVLVRAGADFGCMAANTPHLVFDKVKKRTPLPLISIVRATAEHAKALGVKKAALLGTGFTMGADFYPEEFSRIGIDLVRPTEQERAQIHKIYIGELLNNQFLPESREAILAIAARLRSEEGAEVVALAGTELPLLLRNSGSDIRFLDTAVIHVEAIVEELLR